MSETTEQFERRMRVWEITGQLPEADATRPAPTIDIGDDMRRLIREQVDCERGNVREQADAPDTGLDRLFGSGGNRFFESTEEIRQPGDYLFGDGYGHLFGDA